MKKRAKCENSAQPNPVPLHSVSAATFGLSQVVNTELAEGAVGIWWEVGEAGWLERGTGSKELGAPRSVSKIMKYFGSLPHPFGLSTSLTNQDQVLLQIH